MQKLIANIVGALLTSDLQYKNINEKLHECDDMEKYRVYGELITANLYRKKLLIYLLKKLKKLIILQLWD